MTAPLDTLGGNICRCCFYAVPQITTALNLHFWLFERHHPDRIFAILPAFFLHSPQIQQARPVTRSRCWGTRTCGNILPHLFCHVLELPRNIMCPSENSVVVFLVFPLRQKDKACEGCQFVLRPGKPQRRNHRSNYCLHP